jgi:hypothetical protein
LTAIVRRKTAFTDLAAVMRTVHFEPLRFTQGPVHLQKDHSFDGFATSLTDARAGKRWRHLERQAIPLGLLVTFPCPLTETVSRRRRGDAFPVEALGTTTARAKRRETIASHLVAVERDAGLTVFTRSDCYS